MPDWEISRGDGPVIATAVHSGHAIRPELLERIALDGPARLREEDPLTDMFVGAGDQTFRARTSRFEIDLNRPEDEAVYMEPSDAWGLTIWNEKPTEDMVRRSLAAREEYYAMMRGWIEEGIARHGSLLVLDIHSFNHRRDGADAAPSDPEGNPDLDLGVTTADRQKFGSVLDAFEEGLQGEAAGRKLDVRRNVRFVDGGNWPEWVFAEYGANVCTVTVEYKKFFMDEWTGQADIAMVEDLRAGLVRATQAARRAL
ncbi:N-formylglutamate amidohydrolase [Palleronia aestuarii]|uniref:N-formylglutamate amidohydrolase n=1 Tax=Palleronia aestuarii TaxID=568105 RepID=A0A2W7NH69_9RHOB|nr:N-formylglutamate amidohydrolase [Palleronia aestuarii]PZX18803.1 N-formylglutamate amidohydrolase [Palleronia aestuarii]